MKHLLLVLLVVSVAAPVSAGPLLESAKRQAETVSLSAVVQPTSDSTYQKSGKRKWAEWLAVGAGAIMAGSPNEECLGRFCRTEWNTPVVWSGIALVTASVISIALPDPDE